MTNMLHIADQVLQVAAAKPRSKPEKQQAPTRRARPRGLRIAPASEPGHLLSFGLR
jgi:hypothetical protein